MKMAARVIRLSRPVRNHNNGRCLDFWNNQPLFYSGPSTTSRQFPQNERQKVILKSLVCPGPQWRPLPIRFVISELSGKQTATGDGERYWILDSDCN